MSLVISDGIVRANGLSKRGLLLKIVLVLFRQDKSGQGKASELSGMYRHEVDEIE